MDIPLNSDILENIFNNMDDAVLITQKNGILLYMNPAASALFGIDPESIFGKKIWEAIPIVKRNDSLVQKFIDVVTEKTKTQQATVEYVNAEKKVSLLNVNITYVDQQDGMFVVVINNVTQLAKVNAAFERYTSPKIADYVLNDPKGEKQGGFSKDVSILMSDLRGFTAASAGLSPSQMVKWLNHYFEKMVSVIERYDGTVIEFLGDGIFVIFGAPKDDPLHALHAVNCAVDMQNAMEAVNEWNNQKGYPDMEMGIGINSGSVVAGNIGSKQKMKYGVMGYAVNLAGRIESFTVGGQILVSENTKALAGEDLQINSVNILFPKGAAAPLTVYDISGTEKNLLKNILNSEISWQKISEKVRIKFHLLDGKMVEKTAHIGYLTAVSDKRHFALLRTSYELKKTDNIMISAGIDLYAKVLGKIQDDYRISFTMRPEGFSEWVNELFLEE